MSTPSPAVDAPAPANVGMGRVARGSTANLVGAVITGMGQFVLTIAVTRGLAKADAGVFFSATSLFLLATTIGQLGTGTGLVYFLSRCRALGRTHLIRSYMRTAIRPVIVTGLAMAVATYVFAPQLARLTSPHHVQAATDYLHILAIFIPFAGLENVTLAATRGLGTMRANALIEQIGRPLLQLALVVGAVVVSKNLLGWAWVVGYLPAGLIAWLWWKRLSGRYPSDPDQRPRRTGREFWVFTSPRAMSSVVQTAMQRFDIVLVGALAGAPAAAVYAAATRFVVAGQMGQQAISLAAQPRLAEALAEKDHHAANHVYAVSTAWLMLVTWPMYLLFMVFGRPLLHVFGKGYGAGTSVLLLLAISMIIATGCGMVDQVLSMAGHTSWNLGNVVVAFGIQFGLDIWLIPRHGVLGAAIGWACAIAVKNLVALVLIAVALRLSPFGRSTATAAALTLACYLAIPIGALLVLGSSWRGLLVGAALGTVAFVVGAWQCRDALHLAALRSVRRRRRPVS